MKKLISLIMIVCVYATNHYFERILGIEITVENKIISAITVILICSFEIIWEIIEKIEFKKLSKFSGQDLSNFNLEALSNLNKKYLRFSRGIIFCSKIRHKELAKEADRIQDEIITRIFLNDGNL
ncbi:MAG: hypothetical protein K6C98_02735 [Treponema sp.]|nr:hypothetical protein [Treponema sp.]